MNLEWRAIPGFEGLYEVSNTGVMRSVDRTLQATNRAVRYRGKVLSLQDNGVGYKYAFLKKGGRSTKMYAHRAVALAFLPQDKERQFVNHKDFNPGNNCVDNLEWVSRYENFLYSYDRGRFVRSETNKENLRAAIVSKMGKAVIGTKIADGSRVEYRALNDCAADGFQPSCVSNCCTGKRSTHAGYTWRFA